MEITQTAITTNRIEFRTQGGRRLTVADMLSVSKELRQRKVPATANVVAGGIGSLTVTW